MGAGMTTPLAILTVDQVAKLCICTADTVRERAVAGDLPGIKLGRDWVFPADALAQALCRLATEQAQARRTSSPRPTAEVRQIRGRQAPMLP